MQETEELVTHIKTNGTACDMPDVDDSLSSPAQHTISEGDANQLFNSILSKGAIAMSPPKTNKKIYYRIAASLAVFFILSCTLFMIFQNREIIEHTSFGEVKNITLPDGSMVALNGNSTMTYKATWDDDQEPRIVKIEGEAFFSILHTKSNQPFLVQTNDEFSVEVVGTKFNFLHRTGRAEVVLSEGQVKVNIRKADALEQINMKPGDAVSYEKKTHAVAQRQVKAEAKSSWRNARLMLDNSSLAEVILRIEETYGVTVQVKNQELLGLKLWGTVPSGNLENLLKGIEASFNLKIEQHDKVITISKIPVL